MTDTTQHDVALVQAVLAHDVMAVRRLLARVTPIVRQRVARVLLHQSKRRGRGVTAADIDDLHQDVLVLLLERDARVLRSWDPTRGLSLQGFVGLVAEREAQALVRSGRRSAWAEHAGPDEGPAMVDPRTPEQGAGAREELSLLLHELSMRLSPRGLQLFEALHADHQSVEEICDKFAMTPNALYTFRSRLQALVSEIQAELSARRSSVIPEHTPQALAASKRVTP